MDIINNIRFNDYEYKRPSIEELTKKTDQICDVLAQTNNFDLLVSEIENYNQYRNYVFSMVTLVQIRHTINTLDTFYEKENDYMDDCQALIEKQNNRYLSALYNSPLKEKLIEKYGKQLFNLIEANLKIFSEDIIPLLQEEAKLQSKYDKLKASAQIEFDGKILNLSQMSVYLTSPNRDIRKQADDKICEFYQVHENEFDEIYDQMIKVRTEIANKLGYDNFIPVAYLRLGRTDYTEKEVKGYRKEILENIVPLATKIFEKYASIIGIPKEEYRDYDMGISFKTGNALPLGDTNYKIECAKQMYTEMGKETEEFVNFMFDKELVDLEAKKGKVGGGYCTSIPCYNSPFVFANFNGTSDDIGVLTHEFGHAFQVYESKGFSFNEYTFPTMEAAEIHSMSMEFFSYPWLDKFFGSQEEKYRFSHLSESITFIPYGALVDHFQHEVYAHPEMTIEERKRTYRKLEKAYMPYKVYDNKFLEKGTWWYKQGHIFTSPFYYIDYTLAQNCAHQFYLKNLQNHEEAWEDYKRICKVGGSKSFLEIIKLARLNNPFIQGTVKKVTDKLVEIVDGFDLAKIDK